MQHTENILLFKLFLSTYTNVYSQSQDQSLPAKAVCPSGVTPVYTFQNLRDSLSIHLPEQDTAILYTLHLTDHVPLKTMKMFSGINPNGLSRSCTRYPAL